MSNDSLNIPETLNYPDLDNGEETIVDIYSKQFTLSCQELLQEKGNKIKIDDFEKLMVEFFEANGINEEKHRIYIEHRANEIIKINTQGLNIFSAKKVNQASNARIGTILFLSSSCSGIVVLLLLSQTFLIKLLAGGATFISSFFFCSCLIGSTPNYSKQIKASADAYGELFHEFKENPKAFESAAEIHNQRMNRTVVYR